MITVNGKQVELREEMTVLEFLEKEGYKANRIAVEKNGEIVPKRTYNDVLIHSGDVIEVVSFVGGG
ncbi:MAG: sulfur carrier protein ThiS [Lachnospiraceae bacterium]